MKKKIVFLIIVLSAILYFDYRNSFTKFTPLLFDDNGGYSYIEYKSLNYNNLKMVLDYNYVESKISKSGEILIKNYINNDKELMHNYTKKALDSKWIYNHKKLIQNK